MWNCRCGERNLNDVLVCADCGGNKIDCEISFSGFKERKQLKERQIKNERIAKNITTLGLDGYYEYKVLSLLDESGFFNKNSGKVDIEAMTKVLNDLGSEGWHLVTAYSNELGKNALSGGVGGAILGVNSTVDENILIFERFIKIE